MRLARYEIHTYNTVMQTTSQKARLEGTPPELKLSIKDHLGSAEVNLQTTDPQIRIDNTRFRDSVGLNTPLANFEKWFYKAKQKVYNRIGEIAAEGVAIMKIENSGGAAAMSRIARNKGVRTVQLTIKPAGLPEVQGIPGSLEIQDVSRTLEINWVEGADTRRYVPWSVSTNVVRKPSVDITVVPGTEALIPIVHGQGLRLDRAI
ncbi:MAG: DUF6470 family protein [Oscillospiraceae bacterium]|nr:DUF6470 family protein [Oscillospiraceae bacterium]